MSGKCVVALATGEELGGPWQLERIWGVCWLAQPLPSSGMGRWLGTVPLFLWLSEEAFTVVPLEAQQVRIVSWMYKVLPRGLLRMEDS